MIEPLCPSPVRGKLLPHHSHITHPVTHTALVGEPRFLSFPPYPLHKVRGCLAACSLLLLLSDCVVRPAVVPSTAN